MVCSGNQLPSVAKNNFFDPIKADFGELNAGGLYALNTLIYQCIYWF